jgi:hypothetical protein
MVNGNLKANCTTRFKANEMRAYNSSLGNPSKNVLKGSKLDIHTQVA